MGGQQIAHGAHLAHSGLYEHWVDHTAGIVGAMDLGVIPEGADEVGKLQPDLSLAPVGGEDRRLCRLAGDSLGLLVGLLHGQADGMGEGLYPIPLALVGVALVVGGYPNHGEAQLKGLCLDFIGNVLARRRLHGRLYVPRLSGCPDDGLVEPLVLVSGLLDIADLP